MASFPSSVKTFTTLVDLTDSVLASHQNERGDEITAIETALVDVIGYLNRSSTFIDGMKLTWNSATSITIGIGACFAENGDVIDATSAITKSSLSLSSSTWYHVYVYLSGGSPAAEVVTTAPAAWKGTAYSKTSDTSRRYVGSIRTDGSGNVYKFVHQNDAGLMLYTKYSSHASPFRVLSSGTAATATAVDCSAVIPITSTVGYFHVLNTADQNLRVSDDSSVSSSQDTLTLSAGNSASQRAVANLPLDSSQDLYYIFDASVGTGGAFVDVMGYYFER